MKTSLKVSVALALATTFASTGAMAADKEFNLGGFARFDLQSDKTGDISEVSDNQRVQLNAVGKATNGAYYVKGVGQLRLDSGSAKTGDTYVEAGTNRVNVRMGRFYDISVWDEGGEEMFVTEGAIGTKSDVFYTAESPRNASREAHVALNYTPSNRTTAQLSLRHGNNVDDEDTVDGGDGTSTTQVRPAIKYNAGRYNLAAAYQYKKSETAAVSAANNTAAAGITRTVVGHATNIATGTAAPATNTTENGFVGSVGTKIGRANVRLSASTGTVEVEDNDSTTRDNEYKRSAIGLAADVGRGLELGFVTSTDELDNPATDANKYERTAQAFYADYTRPLLGVKGAKITYSAGVGEVETTNGNGANATTSEDLEHLGVRVKYSF